MKKINRSSFLILVLALTLLSACGGGGGGAVSTNNDNNNPPAQPTAAVLTLSTAATGAIPASTTINGYAVTITLPAGVTVKASPDSANPAVLVTDTGVVTATGAAAGSQINAIYTPATGTLPGTVKISLVSGTGFAAGEFCKVNCDIATGAFPTASSFTQPTLDDATGWDSTASSTVPSMQTLMSLTAAAVVQ